MERCGLKLYLFINKFKEVVVFMIYPLLKSKITRQTYISKEDMQTKLDLYYFNNRITSEQYDELTKLLESQEK